MALFIAGLILSGVTAFPLRAELDLLASWLGVGSQSDLSHLDGLRYWIAYVHRGLNETYDKYPFVAYGTDWLAFAHLAIAVFFIGPLRRPAEHDWTLVSGVIACAGIFVLALVCGPLRGIPFYWRMIDCSFGLFGAIPLLYCLSVSKKLKKIQTVTSAHTAPARTASRKLE